MHSLTQNSFVKENFWQDRRLYNLSLHWEVLNAKSRGNLAKNPYPKMLYIGLLNACSANCPHCPWFSLLHAPTQTTSYFKDLKTLPTSSVLEILEYAKNGGSGVIFSGPGEPLLDSRFLYFVEVAKKTLALNFLGLATNGMFLSYELFLKLLNLGLDYLDISILFVKNVYNQAEWGFLENYQNTLLKILKTLPKHSPKIKLSISYEAEFLKEALPFFLEVQTINKNCSLTFYDTSAKYWEGGELLNKRHTCSAPFSNLYIFPCGSVGVCDYQRGFLGRVDPSEFCIGNVLNEKLEDIWGGARHIEFCEKSSHLCFDTPLMQLCVRCNSWWNE